MQSLRVSSNETWRQSEILGLGPKDLRCTASVKYVMNFNTNKRKRDGIYKFLEIQTVRKEIIPTNSTHSCLSVTI